ncbi:hypothetical protein EMIT0373P_10156 [Pseudomonas chlororaphis]
MWMRVCGSARAVAREEPLALADGVERYEVGGFQEHKPYELSDIKAVEAFVLSV